MILLNVYNNTDDLNSLKMYGDVLVYYDKALTIDKDNEDVIHEKEELLSLMCDSN